LQLSLHCANFQQGDQDSHKRTKFSDLSNIRVPGGKAAGPKPIKANYDADDARIVDLKQQGYSDEYVARRLADEGRIRYVGRTIGSRWLRIRKALEAKEEEILEDEFSDWHDGEVRLYSFAISGNRTNKSQDERLEQAVKEIDASIEKQIAKLQEKKWLQVATHVAELIQKKKYTPKLCRERYDGLMDGTALPPIELDSDQEGRATMRADRISTNKRLREEAAAAQELEEERKAAAAAANKESKAANAVVRITKAQQKKLDEEKIAKMKKDSAAQRKAQRTTCAQWSAYNRVEVAWLSRKAQTERILSNKLLGLALSYRPPKNKQIEEIEEFEEEVDEDDTEVDEDTIVIAHVPRKHIRTSGFTSDNPAPRKKRVDTMVPRNTTSPRSTISPRTSPRASPRACPRLPKSASPKHVAIGEAPVTAETRASPRINMSMAELDAALAHRDLSRSYSVESHEQVVARLEMEDMMSTVATLKSVLEGHGLSVSGKKEDLIKRLQVYEGEEKERIA
jgi:hypothetical protein